MELRSAWLTQRKHLGVERGGGGGQSPRYDHVLHFSSIVGMARGDLEEGRTWTDLLLRKFTGAPKGARIEISNKAGNDTALKVGTGDRCWGHME